MISTELRRSAIYEGDGRATTFGFPFKVFSSDQVRVVSVSENGATDVVVDPSRYGVTLNPDQDVTPGGEVEFYTPPEAGFSFVILSAIPYLQPTGLLNQGAFSASDLNAAWDRNCALIQQIKETIDRAVKIPAASEESPTDLIKRLFEARDTAERKAAEAGSSASDSAVSAATSKQYSDAVTAFKSEIITVSENLTPIETVSDNIAGVRAVYGSIDNVNTLTQSLSAVDILVGDLAAIKTVSGGIEDVKTVSGSIGNVNTLTANLSTVDSLVADMPTLKTIEGNLTYVQAVGGAIGQVVAVEGSLENIATVVGDADSIRTVAQAVGDVKTVSQSVLSVKTTADYIANVNTAASDISNINTAANNIDNIRKTAGSIQGVNDVSSNIANVNAVAQNVGFVTTVAQNVSTMNTVAGSIGKVNAVGADIEAVKTVADMGFTAEQTTLSAGSAATAEASVITVDGKKIYVLKLGIPAGASGYNDFRLGEDGILELNPIIEIDSALSADSLRPVQNAVLAAKIAELEAKIKSLGG